MVPFGTDETISRVVETYSPMLLRLACTRLDSTADAEDAVQETFLKLLTAKPVFRDAEHEKAWLIRTTLHRASDIRRLAEKRNVPPGRSGPGGRAGSGERTAGRRAGFAGEIQRGHPPLLL